MVGTFGRVPVELARRSKVLVGEAEAKDNNDAANTSFENMSMRIYCDVGLTQGTALVEVREGELGVKGDRAVGDVTGGESVRVNIYIVREDGCANLRCRTNYFERNRESFRIFPTAFRFAPLVPGDAVTDARPGEPRRTPDPTDKPLCRVNPRSPRSIPKSLVLSLKVHAGPPELGRGVAARGRRGTERFEIIEFDLQYRGEDVIGRWGLKLVFLFLSPASLFISFVIFIFPHRPSSHWTTV